MTLQKYLRFIVDEDVRIELELDIAEEKDYLYTSFWLSDYRVGSHSEYSEWTVSGVSFIPEEDRTAEIMIQIKP